MRKEVLPEQLNYNKFPGPHFIHFGDVVKTEEGDIVFKVVHNEKDAFHVESFEHRFSELLLKYDYLVGDWSSDQLRLKGFYEDSNNIRKSNRVSRVEDYLKEYCAFGCAYFILANEHPVEMTFEEERLPKRRKSRKRHSSKESPFDMSSHKEAEMAKKRTAKKNQLKKEQNYADTEHFSSRKRRPKNQSQKRSKVTKPVADSPNANQHFTIRQKR